MCRQAQLVGLWSLLLVDGGGTREKRDNCSRRRKQSAHGQNNTLLTARRDESDSEMSPVEAGILKSWLGETWAGFGWQAGRLAGRLAEGQERGGDARHCACGVSYSVFVRRVVVFEFYYPSRGSEWHTETHALTLHGSSTSN